MVKQINAQEFSLVLSFSENNTSKSRKNNTVRSHLLSIEFDSVNQIRICKLQEKIKKHFWV